MGDAGSITWLLYIKCNPSVEINTMFGKPVAAAQ
jgi:hypothetical protein